jgi:curli biogenesis system outer membrane secretion channel CsgG
VQQSVEDFVNTPVITNFAPKREQIVHGKTIAILEFQDPRGGQTGAGGGALVADTLAISYSRSGKMQVVERQKLESILREHGIRAGEIDVERARQIGVLVRAEYLLAGAVTEYESATREVQLGRIIPENERRRYDRESQAFAGAAAEYKQAYARYVAEFDQWSTLAYAGNPRARELARHQVRRGGQLPPVRSLEEIEEELASRGKRSVLATVATIGVTLRVFNVATGGIVWVGQASKRHTSLHEGLQILTDKLVEDFLRQ